MLSVSVVGVAFLWLILGAEARPSSRTQDHPCDPNLNQPAADPHGYHLRGDRCEGLYIRDVSGSATLLVVSLTESFEDFDATRTSELHLTWPAFGDSRVVLRGYSLRPRLYYRMDSIRPGGSSSYSWPSALLAALRISRKDLGIVAWTLHPVGRDTREVLLPLRVARQPGPARSNEYQLLVRPSVNLEKVFVTVSLMRRDGSAGGFIRKDENLGYGYYPAERPIRIPIAGLKQTGIYRMELGADLAGGGSAAVELWFYHSDT